MYYTDYDQIATVFDGNADRLNIPVDGVLRRLFEQIDIPHILDVGCGTGNYTAIQQSVFTGGQWVGFDPSPKMLAMAREKITAVLSRAVVEKMPFPNLSFDYMAANFTFHHFQDKTAALDELTRVCKPNGLLRIHNLCPKKMVDWWVYQLFPVTIKMDKQRFWSIERLVEELEKRRWSVKMEIEVQRVKRPLIEIHTQILNRDTSQITLLDEDSYTAGLRQVEQQLAANPHADITYHIAFLHCLAKKSKAAGWRSNCHLSPRHLTALQNIF